MIDPYLTEWEPRAYLRQYYTIPYIPDDSRALLGFLREYLPRRVGGYNRAVEFGCGPTLYTALALVPHVQRLFLADYLPGNLDEMRRWLVGDPDAHDWDVYVRYILEQERGRPPTANEVTSRESELRCKVAGLLHADIRQPQPLGSPQAFDLVASFFCVEAVSTDVREWEVFLGWLSSLVAPGGSMVLAAMRRCSRYEVLGRVFPAARVDEADFLRVLPHLGFEPDSLVIQAVPTAEWTAEGFDSICLVAAHQQGQRPDGEPGAGAIRKSLREL
jgi:hypothetical protein